jgi:hypothetical protein
MQQLCFDGSMLMLPSAENSFLLRTTFPDDELWADVLSVVLTANGSSRSYFYSRCITGIRGYSWDGSSPHRGI